MLILDTNGEVNIITYKKLNRIMKKYIKSFTIISKNDANLNLILLIFMAFHHI